MSAAFFITGYAIHRYNIRSTGFFGIICLTFVYIGQLYWYSELPSCPVEKIIPYFVTAILGTLMTMQVSRIVSCFEGWIKRFLVFTGDHTLEILTWHFLCFKLVNMIAILVEHKPIEYLALFPVIGHSGPNVWWLFYTSFGVGIPLFVVWVTQQIKKRIRTAEA